MADLGDGRALYSISVTAELTGVNPQMLRAYESKGLLTPLRTKGGTRRYSGRDLDRIGEITTLLAAGLNLAGVEHVLALRAETLRLRAEIDRLRARMTAANDERHSAGSRRSTNRSWPRVGRDRATAG